MKEQNKSINAQSFINDILTPLNNDCQKDPPPDDLKWTIHFDNSPTYTSKNVGDFLFSSCFEKLPHPPYSPDLSPLYFAIFGTYKNVQHIGDDRSIGHQLIQLSYFFVIDFILAFFFEFSD